MRTTPTFTIYLLGYGLLVAGVGAAASAAGFAPEWIVAIVLSMAGLGVIGALSRTKRSATTQ